MKTISQKIEALRKKTEELEKGLYKIVKGFCDDNDVAINYIMDIHDQIVENEANTVFLMCEKNNNEAMEQFTKTIFKNNECSSLREKTGFVYILEDKGVYKIGRTIVLKNRLKTHKSSNLNINFLYGSKEVKKYSKLEAFLHASFSDKRVYNEWFKLTEEELEMAMEIIKQWEINNGVD